MLFQVRVEGVQIYRCEGVDPNVWTYRGTEAKLLDLQAREFGVHVFTDGFPSPKGTWSARDGSVVSGEIIQRENAPAPQAVPWLLIAARDHRESGVLSQVESIRQVETTGGIPIVRTCTRMDEEIRLPFSALHQFYAAGQPE